MIGPLRNALQRWVEVPVLCRLLPVPPGGDILELGCGQGNAWQPLRRALQPGSLVGVDLETEVGLRGDIRSLPFAAGSFDLVIDFGTCQGTGPGALQEVARVLRPTGLFVHETRAAQLLAHPMRRPTALSWAQVPELSRVRSWGLWSARARVLPPGDALG